MGIVAEYVRLSAEELERALTDPSWTVDDEGAETEAKESAGEADARSLYIDKAWHAIDFLLERIEFPVDIVYGVRMPEVEGRSDDWGYGPPGYLDPAQVAQAAAALERTPVDSVLDGVTPGDLAAADIYPSIWDEEDSLDYPKFSYEEIVAFFRDAARDGDAVLMMLS